LQIFFLVVGISNVIVSYSAYHASPSCRETKRTLG